MAGVTGPAPKDPSERRNTTKPQRGEWIDIDARTIDKPVLPEMPPFKRPFVPWRWKARQVWTAWRNDPVTTYWTDSDIEFAIGTLELYDVIDGDWTVNAAEIRQREDRLGLNPKGKRDLRFRITFGAGKEATKNKPPLPDNVVSIDKRMAELKHGA
jgi:hypothetical protein